MRSLSSCFSLRSCSSFVMWTRQDQSNVRYRKPSVAPLASTKDRHAPKLGHFLACPGNEALVRSISSVRCPPKDGQTDTQFMYPT